ncbi:MAG: DUF411 domain-containing protein [Gemmatimonadaceae bacterium]
MHNAKRKGTLLLSAFALVATLAAASSARHETTPVEASLASSKVVIQVFKSPSCGCCKAWVTHMRDAGFDAQVVDMSDAELQTKKASLGVGAKLQSCHTAVVNGYVVEGHVPAADVKRLIAEKPAIVGLAAPGMPRGSPGMEMPGGAKDAYDVVAFEQSGATRVFAKH